MIDEILEAAKKATPGPWAAMFHQHVNGTPIKMFWLKHPTDDGSSGVSCGSENASDAAHIAKCSPENIIALCEFVKAWEQWWSEEVGSLEQSDSEGRMLEAYRRLNP